MVDVYSASRLWINYPMHFCVILSAGYVDPVTIFISHATLSIQNGLKQQRCWIEINFNNT